MAGIGEMAWVAGLRAIADVTTSRSPMNAAVGLTVAETSRAEPRTSDARRSISRGPGKGDLAGVAQVEALGDVLLSRERWPSG